MVQQLAPSRALCCLLALPMALVLAWTAAGSAQQSQLPPIDGAGAGEDPAAQRGILDPTKSGKAELEERYEDPKAQPALANTFPELFPTVRALPPSIERQIDAMAGGQAGAEKNLIDAYIRYQTSQLTSHRNLDAMINPTAQSRPVQAVEDAGVRLVKPLLTANQAKNLAFRSAFTRALVICAPGVLENHLYARLMFMVALSRSGDPQAIPVFVQALRDPEQPLAVQMLAAVGLNIVAGGGTVNVETGSAINAARALTEFLSCNKGTFWPAQARAIQTLGALRQSDSNPARPDPDLAAIVLAFLADPQAHPVVRAWAAWALGMHRPNPESARINVQLIVYHIGQAAVDIGQRIVDVDATNPQLSGRSTDLLLQILLGFEGEPGVPDAGLLKANHPNLAAHRRAIDPIAARVRELARTAVELNRSAGVQRPRYRETLATAVSGLRTLLEKSPPADVVLYPGGPSFPIAKAGAPGRQARAEGSAWAR